MKEHAKVPCNGCKACCSQAVFLFPDEGDDVSQYETEEAINPLSGKPSHMLRTKPNGDCYYLGEAGCTIYDRIPLMCRVFDCRRWYQQFTRQERRSMVAKGMMPKNILEAGRVRIGSLTQPKTAGVEVVEVEGGK
jgi:Fe-S-cluster containining protein